MNGPSCVSLDVNNLTRVEETSPHTPSMDEHNQRTEVEAKTSDVMADPSMVISPDEVTDTS